uniref:Uncharacterized protein n=1 Tax=viral metagenome TaxID=1070528 RepID=A0A6H1Z837_9ZZZZ
MNFLVCDSAWTLGPAGEIGCSGALTQYTTEEMSALVNPGLSNEDRAELISLTIALFAAVFVILVIKKVL